MFVYWKSAEIGSMGLNETKICFVELNLQKCANQHINSMNM